MSIPDQGQLHKSLMTARFEVLPLRGAEEQVAQLPPGVTVTITASPTKGLTPTLDLATTLAARGYHVVPHLAARLIRDRSHLADILDRAVDEGMSEVFVIAGDAATPAGEFHDALALLRGIAELGHDQLRIGITGYPEPHKFIADQWTIRAMTDKAAHASYIVSQICYDPAVTASWVRSVRDRGIGLPIHIGVPGVVDPAKLLRMSMKIGLGDSIRFLRKQHNVVARLLTRYTPEELIEQLAPCMADPDLGIAGWHFFTFNEISRTDQWRRDMAARLEGVPA